jgi:hypothetical protein
MDVSGKLHVPTALPAVFRSYIGPIPPRDGGEWSASFSVRFIMFILRYETEWGPRTRLDLVRRKNHFTGPSRLIFSSNGPLWLIFLGDVSCLYFSRTRPSGLPRTRINF